VLSIQPIVLRFWFDIINLTRIPIPVGLSACHGRNSEEMRTKEAIVSRVKTTNLWAYRILRVIIGGVFIYSGAVKVLDVKGFARMVSQYNLVPDQLLAPVAYGLPIVELLAGFGLIFEIPGTLTAISGMLVMFIGILWYGILKNLDIDCGCFSTEELTGQDSLRQALYRDLAMIAVCGYFYLYRIVRIRRTQSSGRWPLLKKLV
jgi:uncharacterized membrane protein YphA (DoxX/SURF4 family)